MLARSPAVGSGEGLCMCASYMWLQWLGLCTLTKSSTTSLSIAQCPEKGLTGLQKRTMGTSASDLAPVYIACVSKARPSQRQMLLSGGPGDHF